MAQLPAPEAKTKYRGGEKMKILKKLSDDCNCNHRWICMIEKSDIGEVIESRDLITNGAVLMFSKDGMIRLTTKERFSGYGPDYLVFERHEVWFSPVEPLMFQIGFFQGSDTVYPLWIRPVEKIGKNVFPCGEKKEFHVSNINHCKPDY